MRPYQRIVFSIAVLFCILFALPAFADTVDVMGEENGPLENIQVIFLFLGSIFFLLHLKKSTAAVRCVLSGGALLCLSFILRELDVEDLAVPQWVIAVGSGTGRNLIMAVCWVTLGVFVIKSFSALKEMLKPLLRSRTFILLVIAGLFLLSGELFDHERIHVEHTQLIEEILETTGYCIVFIAAILSRSLANIAGASRQET